MHKSKQQLKTHRFAAQQHKSFHPLAQVVDFIEYYFLHIERAF
jgi:hypothetical protein